MRKKIKKAGVLKLSALFFAVAVAVCGVYGGALRSARAEEHTHKFSQMWRSGYKNHWHECECGTVRDMAEHSYENEVCVVCYADKPDPAHIHNFDTSEWKYDSVNHWHESTCHFIVKDIAPHKLSGGVCACGYSVNPGGEEPDNPDNPGGNPEFPEDKEPVELPAALSAAGGYNESLYAEWPAKNVAGVTAYYRPAGAVDWTAVDERLVRMVRADTARFDAVGLKAGDYNIKIESSVGAPIEVSSPITVSAYDRSGYAHFDYDTGVGAYNDDGTLKDGALVIYVTNANKNNVKDFVYKNTVGGLVKEDITRYIKGGVPAYQNNPAYPLGGDSYWGIGYILNNRGYANNTERANYGIQKLCYTYGAVAVRFLDKVTSEYDGDSPTLYGLTYYAKSGASNPFTGEGYSKGKDVPNGGSVGDNGQMARITNARNVTLEGVGETAGLSGWGVHYVSNDNLHTYDGAGTSFEVRNLSFENYPEDAIGMEGTQGTKVDPATGSITGGASSADADLISPVERCWVHNNVFYPGHCEKPAESDKAEGDGSCDFKRGQYYTLSYNYFEYCHKTNLIGSSDSSVTYNVTMHHNWWNNCGARQPLVRRANLHFYNNYVSGDSSDPKASLSYITSARANSYMFSENNYFDGCKSVVELASGGVVKAYGNTYYACFNGSGATEAALRTREVSNSCKFLYRNIDYSRFDTDPALFYYDSETEQSDCLLDTAEVARARVMMYAGVNGFGKIKAQTAMNAYLPKSAVTVGEAGLTVNLASVAKGSSVVSAVEFNGITGVSGGTVKGKGQIITFTLASEAQLDVTSATSGDPAPELVGEDGTVYLSKFTGERTIVLQAGTYFIASGQKDKEATITALSFADTAASSTARVKAAEDAIKALPSEITVGHGSLIEAAEVAYGALTDAERQNFDAALKLKYEKAIEDYEKAQINYVVELIESIGEVDADSYDKITAAQTAYNDLAAYQQAKISAEIKQILFDAQSAYAQFAVINVIDMIDGLEEVGDNLTAAQLEQIKAEYERVNEAFLALDDGEDNNQQAQVTNSAKLLGGLEKIAQAENLVAFREMLAATDEHSVTSATGAALEGAYERLTAAQKQSLTEAEKSRYLAVIAKYEEILSSSVKSTFLGGTPSDPAFVLTGSAQNADNKPLDVAAYGGTLASGLKMETNTEITFTITSRTVLTLYLKEAGKSIKIGKEGETPSKYKSVADAEGDNVVAVTLEAGTYKITKDNPATLYYATLTPDI